MRGILGLVLLAGVLVTPALRGQTVRFHLQGAALTYQEIRDGRDGTGAGGGGGIELNLHRFRVEATAFRARVEPDGEDFANFDLAQVDVRIGYWLTQFLALEVGGGRRYVKPDFAAQEVGMLRVGFFSENTMNRLSSVWVRGAYLVNPQFSGGGAADVAFEFGLGVGLGTANGRFRFQVEYDFQRIDREVGAFDVPIQMSVGRTGIAIGF